MGIYIAHNVKEADEATEKIIESKANGLIVLLTEKIEVCIGQYGYYDKGYCKANGIETYDARHLAGSVVCFPGDISLMFISWGTTSFAEEAINTLVKMLNDRGVDAIIDHNDVMVDDKKVASYAIFKELDGWVKTGVHFSVNSDIDVIEKICTKPMVKIPGQLSDYGIGAEDIQEALNLQTMKI